MRVLLIGATGYVASRTIPVLLGAGHTVTAAARSPEKLRAFWWADRVTAARLDVTDDASVSAAVAHSAADAIVYLVHGMGGSDFRTVDRQSAQRVRRAADAAGINRIVYLSGIIPAVGEERLSEHLISRLEVEQELSRASATVITLRAAMIIGAGSTSLALIRQLVTRLPVIVVPSWMRHLVEPIAITDVAAAIEAALRVDLPTGQFSIGGGTVMSYPELIDLLTELSGLIRPQLPGGPLPEPLVAKAAAVLTDLPGSTVEALIESLQEDMVSSGDSWRSELFAGAPAHQPLTPRAALARALAQPDLSLPAAERDPLAVMPGDRC
ncbi:NAD(P)H-binding protein [Brevibacterium luteolum]|uniref:Epimerase n=2 Tax=Brevibacterium luteolum TaxID=199591 RepID=A0A2N6PIB3_9MICO|nr:NAD(P)H-binding protein [Brevibacterium luteolum]PMB98430.1 epimerase [Brevibacterium luteolum]